MIIHIDNAYDHRDVKKILIANNITSEFFDNAYQAVCNEEIKQAIDNSNVLTGKTFYDICEDEDEDEETIIRLTREFNDSRGANNVFQQLAEEVQDFVDEELKDLEFKHSINFEEGLFFRNNGDIARAISILNQEGIKFVNTKNEVDPKIQDLNSPLGMKEWNELFKEKTNFNKDEEDTTEE